MPSKTFNGQSGWQKWAVPNGVTVVTVDIQGAGSGGSRGGSVNGTLKVKKTDVLYLLVGTSGDGASGRQGGAGGHGGGGAGGDGSAGNNGGHGGGGAAAVRLNSTTGTIKAVAGGAGGKSGDNGAGGDGGGLTGLHGSLGNTSGGGQVGNATGGTQIQGGAGGDSALGSGLRGKDGQDSGLGQAGRGGQDTSVGSHGGGGGGGGFRAGGGGAAARIAQAPGGGGGGGSNFTGGLQVVKHTGQGDGNTGDAIITLTWVSPPPADQPPTTPSDAKVNGKAESSGMSTRSTGQVTISAIVRDSDSTTVKPTHVGGASTQRHQKTRLLVRFSRNKQFHSVSTVRSDLVDYGKRASVKLTGLALNTHYYAHLYSEDSQGKLSTNYNAVDFWTNRDPDAPVLQAPGENAVVLDTDATTFDWRYTDPDSSDDQSMFRLKWRRAAHAGNRPGEWHVEERATSFDNFVVDPRSFKGGVYYEWTVQTRDGQHRWGPYAVPRSFYVLGAQSPPRLNYPTNSQSVDVSDTVRLNWTFRDPNSGAAQVKADYQFRAVGADGWVVVTGDTTVPGTDTTWDVPLNTFAPGVHYEWAMRTYPSTSPSIPSDWTDPEDFWSHGGIGTVAGPVIEVSEAQGELGCGNNRVFIYDRGGEVLRGEITPLASVTWGRQRDDLGQAQITANGFGADCGALLASVHTWMHELVIFRDGVRVFEGPITLIEDDTDGFTIQAKDVMGYVYRRIMRQGYNDSYHLTQGLAEGVQSVVTRAGLIIADALARNDPNVLPYLTLLSYPSDAHEARSVPDWSKTAFDEIDDMAANAGLDYSVIGRRIILNDTHRPVGRLPEFRSSYFASPPKITEYGMLLADVYGVTNGTGLWGAVEKKDSPYGGVELLVSSFSQVGGADGEVLSKAKQEAVRQVLEEQARRGIASRYPAPYIVRVPDNTQLLPTVPVGINQLVPGVWLPVRAQGTVVEISQWQKLDAMEVSQVGADEQVTVTMSPAPNAGEDPDAEDAAAAEAVG